MFDASLMKRIIVDFNEFWQYRQFLFFRKREGGIHWANMSSIKFANNQQGLWSSDKYSFIFNQRSQVQVSLGIKSPLLGSTLPSNMGLSGANPNLVELQCRYQTPSRKSKNNTNIWGKKMIKLVHKIMIRLVCLDLDKLIAPLFY